MKEHKQRAALWRQVIEELFSDHYDNGFIQNGLDVYEDAQDYDAIKPLRKPLGCRASHEVVAAAHGVSWNLLLTRPTLPRLAPDKEWERVSKTLTHHGILLSDEDLTCAILEVDILFEKHQRAEERRQRLCAARELRSTPLWKEKWNLLKEVVFPLSKNLIPDEPSPPLTDSISEFICEEPNSAQLDIEFLTEIMVISGNSLEDMARWLREISAAEFIEFARRQDRLYVRTHDVADGILRDGKLHLRLKEPQIRVRRALQTSYVRNDIYMSPKVPVTLIDKDQIPEQNDWDSEPPLPF